MSGTTELKIPVALGPGERLVRPSDAAESEGTDYSCPKCSEELIFKNGTQVRAHFSHAGGSACGTPESILHRAAKRHLAALIEADISERSPGHLTFLWDCPICEETFQKPLQKDQVEECKLEESLEGGRRPDILLLSESEEPIAGIEVYHSHEVSEEKNKDLEIPWAEIHAEDIIQARLDSKSSIPVRRASATRFCTECQFYLEEIRAEVIPLFQKFDFSLPPDGYTFWPKDCPECGVKVPYMQYISPMTVPAPPPYMRGPPDNQYGPSEQYFCPNCDSVIFDLRGVDLTAEIILPGGGGSAFRVLLKVQSEDLEEKVFPELTD